MRITPERFVDRPLRGMLTLGSPIFGMAAVLDANATSGSGTWPTASVACAIPFRLGHTVVVTHLGWVNGSSAGGNHDIGIYRTDFTKVVSSGNVAGSGNSTWQFADITDTALPPGDYYLAKTLDSGVANRANFVGGTTTNWLKMMGVYDSTDDLSPLPDTLTNMVLASTFTSMPQVAIMLRTPF